MVAPTFRGTARFEIVRRLGAGGMGVVYEAIDKERGTRVALKTLHTPNPDAILRFKSEFRMLQDVKHPNLVSLGEFFCENDVWFIVMELLDGVRFLEHVWPGCPAALQSTTTSTAPFRPVPADPRPPTPPGPAFGRPPVDGQRLRNALAQVAQGLIALHGAGIVHRDVKPSNVMVTREGRAVLLDFGLVTRVDPESVVSETLVGTVPYMSPEQAATKHPGPESDWYAVGSMLYEALTGLPPFQGPPLGVLMEKQRREPRSPRGMVPVELNDLCDLAGDLLRIDPKARPAGPEVLQRLGMTTAARWTPPAPLSAAMPFVGRSDELQLLTRAFEDVVAGRPTTMIVRGESGVGKSALVRRFTQELKQRTQAPVVLAGRCYESETVPYKAFDGVVDALLRAFKRMTSAEVLGLMPRNPGLLSQMFPALRSVPAIALAPGRIQQIPDPVERRNRMFAAFRELLYRIADRKGLVLVVDDLQWADADSVALLVEILHEPDPPPLLFVATARPELDLPLPGDVRTMALDALPRLAAKELAFSLMERAGGSVGLDADQIALEARGHPLFIDELVRHGIVYGPAANTVSLCDALWARIEALEPASRRLVELVAVAGAPLRQDVAAHAMAEQEGSLDPPELEKAAGYLRVANLVRIGGPREARTIEPYHDRVRESVLGHLAASLRKELHGRLARALSISANADPESLAIHWREAGDEERAGTHAAAAARQAMEAFAFARAARLYQLAIQLRPRAVENSALNAELGHALANAGRGAEAASAFLAATAGADAARALELRWRAGSQFMRSGYIDRGLSTLATVLEDSGARMPRTQRGALLSLLYSRARLRLRGLRFRELAPNQIAARDLVRIDVLSSMSIGFSMADIIRGADFHARSVLLALRSGEPSRIARSLAMEALYNSCGGPASGKRTHKLLRTAEGLAARLGDPQTVGLVTGYAGSVAFNEARWADSLEMCDRATAQLREGATDVGWEIDTFQTFALWAVLHLGEFKNLSERLPVLLRDALDRGDCYAATNFRAGTNVLWLAHDEVEAAINECDEAVRMWSRTGFHLQHFYDLLARCQADIYTGRPRDALRRFQACSRPLARSLLLRALQVRINFWFLRGRVAVAASASGQPDADRLLASAERDARRLGREETFWARTLSLMLRAAVARRRGQDDLALTLLAEAQTASDASGTKLYTAASKRYWGHLVGGQIGREAVREANAFMLAQTIRSPDRMCNLLMPGFMA